MNFGGSDFNLLLDLLNHLTLFEVTVLYLEVYQVFDLFLFRHAPVGIAYRFLDVSLPIGLLVYLQFSLFNPLLLLSFGPFSIALVLHKQYIGVISRRHEGCERWV